MNTPDNDGWISVKTHGEPVDSDYPIYAYDEECRNDDVWHIIECTGIISFSHWKRAPKLPATPKKELTQREMDDAEFKSYTMLSDGGPYNPALGAYIWIQALAYRDKQNREDLKSIPRGPYQFLGQDKAVANLRKRCGLDKP